MFTMSITRVFAITEMISAAIEFSEKEKKGYSNYSTMIGLYLFWE